MRPEPSCGDWSEIEVAGHRCHVFEPARPGPHGYVVLYLHDLPQTPLREHLRFERLLDARGLRAICPVTGRSWWTDRIHPEFDPEVTAEQFVVRDVLAEIDRRWVDGPSRVALLGTGMGGQGALRLAYKYPNRFPVVAAISPEVDYYRRMEQGGDETLSQMYGDPEEARQDTAILHVHPLNWPRHQYFCCDPGDVFRWDSADRLRMKLMSLGVPHVCDLETEGGEQDFDYCDRMAEPVFAFLTARLEEERLRVPPGG